ncbi:MAG: MaoC/PaaZ C-terminal domain-containing protein [Pseudomonadota bacterium]
MDLVLFSTFTGDWHPLDTNVEYAKNTPLGERIAHGMLTPSAWVAPRSSASGLMWPCPGLSSPFTAWTRSVSPGPLQDRRHHTLRGGGDRSTGKG